MEAELAAEALQSCALNRSCRSDTDAVNQVGPKAYGIGICSVEEIGLLEDRKSAHLN
jgi:hypothetical protein